MASSLQANPAFTSEQHAPTYEEVHITGTYLQVDAANGHEG
jgi:hypothetical protein